MKNNNIELPEPGEIMELEELIKLINNEWDN